MLYVLFWKENGNMETGFKYKPFKICLWFSHSIRDFFFQSLELIEYIVEKVKLLFILLVTTPLSRVMKDLKYFQKVFKKNLLKHFLYIFMAKFRFINFEFLEISSTKFI